MPEQGPEPQSCPSRAHEHDSKGTGTDGGTTTHGPQSPALPIASPKGLSAMCSEGTGEQKERGEVCRGKKGCFFMRVCSHSIKELAL